MGDGSKICAAGRGKLQRFQQQNGLSRQHHTTMVPKDLELLTEELIPFVDYTGKAVGSKMILERLIIAMDKTAVFPGWDKPVNECHFETNLPDIVEKQSGHH